MRIPLDCPTCPSEWSPGSLCHTIGSAAAAPRASLRNPPAQRGEYGSGYSPDSSGGKAPRARTLPTNTLRASTSSRSASVAMGKLPISFSTEACTQVHQPVKPGEQLRRGDAPAWLVAWRPRPPSPSGGLSLPPAPVSTGVSTTLHEHCLSLAPRDTHRSVILAGALLALHLLR